MNQRIRFLHPVGKSTIRQGITVPISAQSGWLGTIEKGQHRDVTIQFDSGHMVGAIVRRINNARGHLQFRYETKAQESLRQYLKTVFTDEAASSDAVVEVIQRGETTFEMKPVRGRSALAFSNPFFHGIPKNKLGDIAELAELNAALKNVPYRRDFSQRDYNRELSTRLHQSGWRSEAYVTDGIGLRCDFEKNGIWLEVEFGNARAYYQDYIKFLLAHKYRSARCGVLLSPTDAFAGLLCDLGCQRAAAKRGMKGKSLPSYSGMMSHEKALREFPHLSFILEMPLVLGGIDVLQVDYTGQASFLFQ